MRASASLSAFYFFYFASLAVFMPYWNPYLEEELKFTNMALGVMTAVMLGTRVLSPLLWGWLVDHNGRRIEVIRLTSLAVPLIAVAVFWVTTPWEMAILLFCFSFFWNAALPQVEAAAFDSLGAEQENAYAFLRMWGSVGFVVVVIGIGALIDATSLPIILPVMLGLLVIIWLTTMAMPASLSTTSASKSVRFRDALKQPVVWALLVVCCLNQLTHMPYYTFFTIFLGEHGYNKTQTGLLFALGVVAEIALFAALPFLWKKISAWTLLVLASVMVVVRWALVGWVVDVWWLLVFTQLLHMFTYGAYHAAAIVLIREYFPGQAQGRGQALYSAASFGLGGAMGALLSGSLREWWGDAWMFTGAAAIGVVALVAAVLGAKLARRADEGATETVA